MCRALKTYVAASVLIIIASLIYKISPLVIYQTTSKEHLNSLGYQYLGDKYKFEHWKVNYRLFKKSLNKSISIFENINDDLEGGYLLQKWCAKNVGTKLGSQTNFKLVKRHCVVNLKNVILEEGKLKPIDEVSADKRREFLKSKLDTCKPILQYDILKWCSINFRTANIPKNYANLGKAKTCCAINTGK